MIRSPRLCSIAFLSSAIVLSAGSTLQADDYAPKVGAQHAAFVLPAIDDGRAVSLEQYRGKKVLLIQFASW